MKRLVMILAAVVPLSALVPVAASSATQPVARTAPQACSTFSVPAPAGARIESVVATDQPAGDVTFPADPPFPAPQPVPGVPAHCDVTVTLTHGTDHVKIKVLLPTQNWNHRFQAVGGGAYYAGDFTTKLYAGVKNGYAVATTDGGLGPSPIIPSWALTSAGSVDKTLLTNFAYRAPHELAQVGKAVTQAYYGRAAAYTYWNGCSTGGRQGYSEAQRYPGDFDGILAESPAINWDRWSVAAAWPAVVMNAEKTYPTSCELAAFNTAAVAACDTDDGVRDGVIDEPGKCDFAPESLVGQTVLCEGEPVTISAADARVVRRIWDGPRGLWYGLNRGAPFGGLVSADAAGGSTGAPFIVADSWIKFWLQQNPQYDAKTIGYAEFVRLFLQSRVQYNHVIGTDNPDLSAFKRAGGKLLSWHGGNDELVFQQGTVDYRKRVERTVGGDVNSFYRLFLAPGAQHCGGGVGPAPTDPLAALVSWVEQGKAPKTLPAATADGATRNLCAYPLTAHYTGQGDPKQAVNFVCR
ncbi:tannase/feruloyl esterase family alpha/beta hydrolase [Kribbella sp. CA-253562]|uniref:tannase/feruloyl esterase family alpha/beta hydrolase n=1 Tax=Kribbella sp. CA-253562 TaxID=3239942 RepID=UPI003D91D535